MGHRHNVLTDEVFKNSKYIDMIQRHYGIKNFRKEQTEQYKILLDIFQTFILVNNCFESDSNSSLADKTDKACKFMEKLLYNNFEESQKHKYSVRDIKGLCDKRARKLYNYMTIWQKQISSLTSKSVNTSIEVKQMIELIEEEMQELEAVGFDNIVSGNISYQKNWVKYSNNYTMVIDKFNDTYSDNINALEQYKQRIYNLTGDSLTENEMEEVKIIFRLVTNACNGLIKVICNYNIEDHNISDRSSAKYIYKAYLKSFKVDFNNIDNFEEISQIFKMTLMWLTEYINKNKMPISVNEVLNNYDMLYFMVNIELFVNGNENISKMPKVLQKIVNDLKQVYTMIDKVKSEPILNNDYSNHITNFYIPAYDMVKTIVDNNKDFFMEVS